MENWKPIAGFEGSYEISDMGRARSVSRTLTAASGKSWMTGAKILRREYKNGKPYVRLHKGGAPKDCPLQALVAKHFVPNPNGYSRLAVKDGIDSNCEAENLAWVRGSLEESEVRALIQPKPLDDIKSVSSQPIVMCISKGKVLHVADMSRSMAQWLIGSGITSSKSVETVSHSIRQFAASGGAYYGYTFVRADRRLYDEWQKGGLLAIPFGRAEEVAETSKDLARKMLASGMVSGATVDTVARNIRKAVRNGRRYHGVLILSSKAHGNEDAAPQQRQCPEQQQAAN